VAMPDTFGSPPAYFRYKAAFLERRGDFHPDMVARLRLQPLRDDPYPERQLQPRGFLEESRDQIEDPEDSDESEEEGEEIERGVSMW
jgi:hypothetical protein